MAVSATATINSNAGEIPNGFVPPILPAITPVEEGTYVVDLSIANADPIDPLIGIQNVLDSAATDFETVQAITFKLDVAQVINANLTITNIQRTNTNSSIYVTGTEVFRCSIYYEYE